MTPEKREELRRLAEAATPGPWSTQQYGPDHVEVLLPNGFSRVISDPTVVTDYDARFISAANPSAVLDLLADAGSREAAQKAMGEELSKIDAALDAAGRPAAAFTSERVAELILDNERLRDLLADISTRCETKELRECYSPDDANVARKSLRVLDEVWAESRLHGTMATVEAECIRCRDGWAEAQVEVERLRDTVACLEATRKDGSA